jgi:hypothetical protein
VVDRARGNLVVPNQACEYRKAGGIRASPLIGTLLDVEKVPHGTASGRPACASVCAGEKLIEEAIGFVEDENVAIARG